MSLSLLYTLALTYVSGVGVINSKKILEYVGSAEKVWQLKRAEWKDLLPNRPDIISQFLNDDLLLLAEKEIRLMKENNIKAHLISENDYPNKLKQCQDAPLIVFTKGNLPSNRLKIAIVGTRKMTNYGKQFIQEFIKELSNQNVSIVSGLAFGCDIQAHRSALSNSIPTYAVLAGGLNHITPKAHEKEAKQMLENGGLISEFSSFHKPEPVNFIRRNRIIAGLCDAVIVVESGIKGGSITTANYANGYNRDVFALPGQFNAPLSRGCNQLIKNNLATLIENADDLLGYFNIRKNTQKVTQKSLFIEMTDAEEETYNFLKNNGKKQIDQIAFALKKPTYLLSSTLLNLELKGLVRPLSGKFFESI